MKVLLPIDGSDCAKETLRWAEKFLDKVGTEIYLVHVINLFPEVPMSQIEENEAIRFLGEAETMLRQDGYIVAETDYLIDRPAKAICLYAEEKGLDQIIIGSHGRSGLSHALFGSVSAEVFKMSKVPVLVYNNCPKPTLSISHVDKLPLRESVSS